MIGQQKNSTNPLNKMARLTRMDLNRTYKKCETGPTFGGKNRIRIQITVNYVCVLSVEWAEQTQGTVPGSDRVCKVMSLKQNH